MNTSIKIRNEQVEKIDKLIMDKDFSYHSRNDFVVRAVENEILLATFKHNLSASGKYHFDFLYAECINNAYERALFFDVRKPDEKDSITAEDEKEYLEYLERRKMTLPEFYPETPSPEFKKEIIRQLRACGIRGFQKIYHHNDKIKNGEKNDGE